MKTVDARLIRRITGSLPFAGRNGRGGRTLRRVVVLNRTGRDCDGFDMDSICYVLPEDVEAYIEHDLEWADGPLSFTELNAAELRDWQADRSYREHNLMRVGWDDDRF